MASAAEHLLLGTIVRILVNDASSIAGICGQVDDIKEELLSMIAFLQDADEGKKAHTKREEIWVASVRDSVYDVEDLIDEFIYCIYEEKTGGPVARWFHQTILLKLSMNEMRIINPFIDLGGYKYIKTNKS